MARKKKNDENKNPITKYIVSNKTKPIQRIKPAVFKFDMTKILKERQADAVLREKNAEMDKQIKVIEDLFQEEVNEINTVVPDKNSMFSPKQGYVIFDCTKYNISFKDNSNLATKNVYLQQFFQMSIEQNELEAHIIYNSLMNENVSLVLAVSLNNIYFI